MQNNETKERPKREAEVENKQPEQPAVIQLAGGALQSLFGVAYTQDIEAVVKRIDEIDTDLSDNIDHVREDQIHLSDETRNTLSIQDKTIHMVEKMAKTVDKKVGKPFCISCIFFRKFVLVNLLLPILNHE